MLYAAMNIPVLISVPGFTDNRYSYLGELICNSFAECFVNSRFEIRKHLSNDIENASVRSFRNPANLNLFLPSLYLCKAKFPQDKPISFGSALENQLLQPYISLAAQNLDVHLIFLGVWTKPAPPTANYSFTLVWTPNEGKAVNIRHYYYP